MSAARKWGGRGVILALLVGGVLGVGRLMRRPPLEVRVVRVERGTVRDVVTSSTAGEIVAEHRATVRAELGARVTRVVHRRGDRVRAGELVVALDDADLEARLAQARANLAAASAQADQARARVKTLERQAERARLLAERGAGTAQMTEDAQNLLAEAQEAVRAQGALLAQAQAAVKVASVGRGRTLLTAPFAGLLIDLPPSPGDQLQPGASAFEIIDDSRLHVDAAVDEADAAKLKLGQEATLTLDALPGHPIAGRVSQVAPAVRHDLKGARTLPIEVEVQDVAAATAAGLKAGMSANVEVVVAETPDVAWLPTNVIVGRGVKRTVFRVDGGFVHQVEVKVGIGNWDRTQVTDGLAVGDAVVATLNQKGLEDRAQVKISP